MIEVIKLYSYRQIAAGITFVTWNYFWVGGLTTRNLILYSF